MIVRIMGEGQLDVAPDDLTALNALDDEVEAAIEAGDEAKFRTALHTLLDNVRKVGKPLSAEESLKPSELILPPADSRMEDVKLMLRDEGLIPD